MYTPAAGAVLLTITTLISLIVLFFYGSRKKSENQDVLLRPLVEPVNGILNVLNSSSYFISPTDRNQLIY